MPSSSLSIGYDLDGVLVAETKISQWLFNKGFPRIGVLVRDYGTCSPLYIPRIPGPIITGRPITDLKTTQRLLYKYRIQHTGLYMSSSPVMVDMVYHKAQCIIQQHLEFYIESEEEQLQAIREALQRSRYSCEVISPMEGLALGLLSTKKE